MKNIRLTKEEKNILKDVESGKYKPVKNLPKEVARFQQYARQTLNKTRTINIRLSEPDLYKMKSLAVEKRLAYQTFICSVLPPY